MTDRELSSGTEASQLRAFERASGRMSKFIMKRLKQIAKENKIKTTEEFKEFLKKFDSASKMTDLMDL